MTAVKRNFAEARLLTIKKQSKFRVKPKCAIYEACGGCQLMHLRYDQQLDFKVDLLRQALKNTGRLVMRLMTCGQRLGWRSPNITGPSCNSKRDW